MKSTKVVKYLLTAVCVVCTLLAVVSCKKEHEHSFGMWETTVAPTCEKEGKMTRKCIDCDVVEEKVLAKLGHTLKTAEAKAPTCTEDGYNAYEYCTACTYNNKTVVTKTGHNIQTYDKKEPTCTEDGYNAYEYCTVCTYNNKTVVTKTGHDIQTYDRKEPTCTEDGYEAYEKCKTEGCNYTTYKIIPAQHKFVNGLCSCGEEACETHTYTETDDEWFGNTATCTEAGVEYRKCTVCGFVNERATQAKGHDMDEKITTKSTCTQKGEKLHFCKSCDHSYTEEIKAKGHDMDEKITTEPSCTQKGEKLHFCKNCSHSYTEEIKANGHKYEAGTCTKCGTAQADCSHTYGGWYGSTATCQKGGEEYRDCSSCGHTDTREVGACSHKYESKVCIWCGKKDYTLPPQSFGGDE